MYVCIMYVLYVHVKMCIYFLIYKIYKYLNAQYECIHMKSE